MSLSPTQKAVLLEIRPERAAHIEALRLIVDQCDVLANDGLAREWVSGGVSADRVEDAIRAHKRQRCFAIERLEAGRPAPNVRL